MPLKPIDSLPAGGVDSWSNPIRMPFNRYLRLRNIVPLGNGGFRLRNGYSAIPMTGAIDAAAIHSPISYFDGASGLRYVLFWQGTVPKKISMVDFSVSTITVKGNQVNSSNRWCYALSTNGHLIAFNGVDKKWFDGSVWRDCGIRALTAAEVANVGIAGGMREASSTENAAVTLTEGAGGAFSNTTGSGMAFFMSYFDPVQNELGPATLPCGSGRVTITGGVNRKVSLTGLPNLSAFGLYKIISRTEDSQSLAHPCSRAKIAVTSCTRAGTVLTVVTTTAHGFTTGFMVALHGTTNFDGFYLSTVTNATTFTVTLTKAAGANTTGGTTDAVVSLAPSATAIDITLATVDESVTNSDAGLPAQNPDSTQPGYEFFGSIYNLVTGHVGNRVLLGQRYGAANRANVRFSNLPDVSAIDSEWAILLGRTDDSGEVPYVLVDSGGNYAPLKTVGGASTSETLRPLVDASNPDATLPSLAMPNAHDAAGIATFSTLQITTGTGSRNASRLFSSFSKPANSYSSLKLTIVTAFTIASGGNAIIYYSTNGGLTWITVRDANHTKSWTQKTDVIVLAPDQDLASLQIRMDVGTTLANSGALNAYDIRLDGVFVNPIVGATVTSFGTDPSAELPETNGLPPAFVKVWHEADHMCGVTLNSPIIYRSGSELDARNGDFVGLPEQSWFLQDIETFPTGEVIMGGGGYEQESWTGTLNDFAILTELAGDLQWKGPWRIGLGGQFCFSRAWSNLPFWITGDRQLAVGTAQGAEPVSLEYEAALLDQIADTSLDQTETVYFLRPADNTEVLIIKAVDNSGNPFLVIHDFNLRDQRSPYGQAYECRFAGALASDFTVASIRNAVGRQEVWAASGNAFYRLFDGDNDNGTEFLAEGIGLFYAGAYRPALEQIEWYGDDTVQWYVAKSMDVPADILQFKKLNTRPVVDNDKNGHYVASFGEEITHCNIWFQLQSHSAEGSVALSSPPHLPLETYGRIWLVAPQIGDSNPK